MSNSDQKRQDNNRPTNTSMSLDDTFPIVQYIVAPVEARASSLAFLQLVSGIILLITSSQLSPAN